MQLITSVKKQDEESQQKHREQILNSKNLWFLPKHSRKKIYSYSLDQIQQKIKGEKQQGNTSTLLKDNTRGILQRMSGGFKVIVFIGENEDCVNLSEDSQHALLVTHASVMLTQTKDSMVNRVSIELKVGASRLELPHEDIFSGIKTCTQGNEEIQALVLRKQFVEFKPYVRHVFVMDNCEELDLEYLSFVKGVMDSKDLPMHVYCETLQQTRLNKNDSNAIRRIKKNIDFVKSYYEMPDDNIELERLSSWLLRIEVNREMVIDKILHTMEWGTDQISYLRIYLQTPTFGMKDKRLAFETTANHSGQLGALAYLETSHSPSVLASTWPTESVAQQPLRSRYKLSLNTNQNCSAFDNQQILASGHKSCGVDRRSMTKGCTRRQRIRRRRDPPGRYIGSLQRC
eukprot:Gb_09008 [translate_table: standard]